MKKYFYLFIAFLFVPVLQAQPLCSGTPNPGSINAQDTLLCQGDSVALGLTGLTETGLNFQWQLSLDGVTYEGISGAIYSEYRDTIGQSMWFRCVVTCVSSGESVNSAEQYILVSTMPPSGGTITETGTAPSFQFSVSGVPSGYAYSWDFGDGSNMATAATPSHTYTADGTYTVTVIVSNGCGSDTLTHTTSVVSGITDYNNVYTLRIFPNPANDGFNLVSDRAGEKGEMKISDLGGRVYRIQMVQLPVYVSTRGLEAGTYLIGLNSAVKNTVMRLVVK